MLIELTQWSPGDTDMNLQTGLLDLCWPARDGLQRCNTDGSYFFLFVEQNSNCMCHWFLHSNSNEQFYDWLIINGSELLCEQNCKHMWFLQYCSFCINIIRLLQLHRFQYYIILYSSFSPHFPLRIWWQ